MLKKTNYETLANSILDLVGGKENFSFFTHCITRLRFNIKDKGLVKIEEIKKIKGVIGCQWSGEQLQIIIGQTVKQAYDLICTKAGIVQESTNDENLEQKKTFKTIGNEIINYLSVSMIAITPAMIAAALFKTLAVVLGPDMLKIITVESDMYLLCNFIYNAFFYFMPVFLGYSAAKKLGSNIVLGMMLGTMLIVPDFVSMIDVRETFTIYGILDVPVANYGQTVLPVILGVWLMAHVEKALIKFIPDALSSVFVPFLTLAVMIPIMFGICAPLGGYVGNTLGDLLVTFGENGGFIAVAIVGALWQFLVLTGTHQIFGMFAINSLLTNGVDSFVMVAAGCAGFATFGIALGAFLKVKDKRKKSLIFSYFIAGALGGVTEPAMFGVGFKYKRTFLAMMIGGFLGGLYCGIMGVTVHVFGATNILAVLGHVGGGTTNLVNGIIGGAIAFVASSALTYFIGVFNDE